MNDFKLLWKPVYPAPGHIRFLKMTPFECGANQYNWMDAMLNAQDKTLQGWYDLIKEYKEPIFPVSEFSQSFNLPKPSYTFPNVPDPFYHRDIIAKYVEELLTENLRLRWIVRKCIRKWRQSLYKRRIIGTIDLESMCEIPDNWKITVHDPKSNSIYVFHTNTLQKTFVTSLLHQSYAFASPQTPKNPYTNIPWSIGQIIHIAGQIQIRMMENCHSYANTWIIRYRTAKYSLTEFEKRHNKALQILAAKTFFGEPSNLFYTELFTETIRDIFEDMGYPTEGLSYKMILDRVLKADLMKEWDNIAVNSFIHTNHQFFSSPTVFRCKLDFELYIAATYQKTITFVNSTRQALFLRSGQRVILSSV
jgi:hypothetical protein